LNVGSDAVDLKRRLDMRQPSLHLAIVHRTIDSPAVSRPKSSHPLLCGSERAVVPGPGRFERHDRNTNLKGEPVNSSIEIAGTTPELSNRDRRALIACGFWLRIGFIGVCGIAGLLFQLLNGAMNPLSAVALAAGAGSLVAAGWWRTSALLGVQNRGVVAAAAGSPPASSAIAGSAA
jgi:hypothetical protein